MKEIKYYVADFETTTQTSDFTEVWCFAYVELYTENVIISNSIYGFYEMIETLEDSSIVYFHNLKFDGSFILNYLFSQGYVHAFDLTYDDNGRLINGTSKSEKLMPARSFNYLISEMGEWFSIKIRNSQGSIIEIRDSLKLLPLSVKGIGKSFNTLHQKTSIDYASHAHANEEITEEEKHYISNDVLVVKEALEIMHDEGNTKMTIGSCALHNFKTNYDYNIFKQLFPDLTKVEIDESYGTDTVDSYIRKSYKGGWCYLNPKYIGQVLYKGITYDVNSLYPAMMSSDYHYYPVGYPTFWKGNSIPKEVDENKCYYYIRLKCRFSIKENYLPTLQIKNDCRYKYNEWLYSSKPTNVPRRTKVIINDKDNPYKSDEVILTLTCTDYNLLLEHYNVDFEILDGCYFTSVNGVFDNYINNYREMKEQATRENNSGLRTIAKLFLNSLYGKMASSDISNKKIARLEDGVLKFTNVEGHDKQAGYIAIGSAITSYAREYTIRHAQKNYDRFVYADTDSIHLLGAEAGNDIKEHDTKFGYWKCESTWDKGYFLRQKCYIEHMIEDNRKEIHPYYSIKCAGMPPACKEKVQKMLEDGMPLTDFTNGFTISGKLLPKQVKGGVILQETEFTLRL